MDAMRRMQGVRAPRLLFAGSLGVALLVATLAVVLLAVPGAAAPFIGGSWEIGYHRVNTPDINKQLQDNGFPALKSAVVVFGGSGNGPLPIGDGNWTIGGFGAAGQSEEVAGAKRSRLALGYGGVRVGYSRSLTEQLSLETGLGIAFGGVTLTAVQGDPKSLRDGLTSGSESTFSRFLLALVPDAGLSLRLGTLTYLQASVGYFLDTGVGKWHNTVGTELSPQPSDKLSGLRVTLALSFGPGWDMVETVEPDEE